MTDSDFYRAFGQRIAAARKARGLTQADLAARLGISQQTLAHYEGGRARMVIGSVVRLARELDSSVAELLDSAVLQRKARPEPRRRPLPPALTHHLQQLALAPPALQRLVSKLLGVLLANTTATKASPARRR